MTIKPEFCSRFVMCRSILRSIPAQVVPSAAQEARSSVLPLLTEAEDDIHRRTCCCSSASSAKLTVISRDPNRKVTRSIEQPYGDFVPRKRQFQKNMKSPEKPLPSKNESPKKKICSYAGGVLCIDNLILTSTKLRRSLHRKIQKIVQHTLLLHAATCIQEAYREKSE